MGKRGPAPIPDAIKLHEGTYREDRHGGSLKVHPGSPRKPVWLDEAAALIWDETIAELERTPGLLAEVDGAALALYCDARRQYHEFDEQIRKDGNTIISLTAGLKAHPLLARREAARAAVDRLGAKFGMSPSDRASLKPGPTTAASELDDMIA